MKCSLVPKARPRNAMRLAYPAHTRYYETKERFRKGPCPPGTGEQELKGHRDTLIRMVAEGRFPADEPDDTDQRIARIVGGIGVGPRAAEEEALSQEAVGLLLGAAHATGGRQGMIVVSQTMTGLSIFPGNQACPYDVADRRATAKYKAAVEELLTKGLIEYLSDSLYEVTHLGYLRADEIASARAETLNPEEKGG